MASLELTSGIELQNSELPREFLHAVRKAFSMPNPAYVGAVRAGKFYGVQPMRLTAYTIEDGRMRFTRGVLSELRQLAEEYRVHLSFADHRANGTTLAVRHSRELRDYQVRAVRDAIKRQQCIVVAPAGAGKTTIACGIVARAQRTTLVLVGTVDLAQQWRDELRSQLGVEAGGIGGGRIDIRPVTIATVATLAKMDDEMLDATLARFGLLLVDEAHHGAASSWWRVIDRCPAKFRVGLSATPEREDGHSQRLRWLIGPILETVNHAQLLESGRLVGPKVIPLTSQFSFDYQSADDWPKMIDALVSDADRNALIIDALSADAHAGRSILVLTGRIRHAEELAAELERRGIRAAPLTGTTPKATRLQRLAAVRNGELSVLVATSLADEGLDLPRLSRVYLVFPAKAAGRVEQRVGRVMRPAPGKDDCAIVDVVDANVGVLARQARKRQEVFSKVLGAIVELVPALEPQRTITRRTTIIWRSKAPWSRK